MGVLYHCENAHLWRHRSEYTFESATYCQVDSVAKVLHCKAKYAIKLKVDLTLSDAGDLVLLSKWQKLWTFICASENRPFLLE